MSAYPYETVVRDGQLVDAKYPGTAVERLSSVLQRVQAIDSLDGDWADVRRKLLAAGGLRDDRSTGHAFNDDNHCDLATMESSVSHNSNADGSVAQISRRNLLGPHIQNASLPELGPGGSWSTCTNGAHLTPPSDVAHVQFNSRVAFKLVWAPPNFSTFLLVDDEGRELRRGTPTGALPHLSWRQGNYALVHGGKYATAAESVGKAAGTRAAESGADEVAMGA